MRVHFITACRNVSQNVEKIVASVREQSDSRWRWTIIDDCSQDDTAVRFRAATQEMAGVQIIVNSERRHALQNIVEAARSLADSEDIVATLDGDDSLCNSRTVEILLKSYEAGVNVVWTAHRWDTNGMNISGHMPNRVDPYAWPWVTSHLRTFRASLLGKIGDENFKNHRGEWFKRGYDQALMLPLLFVGEGRSFIPEVCYQYNIDSASIPSSERNWAERDQIATVNMVRARGFLK